MLLKRQCVPEPDNKLYIETSTLQNVRWDVFLLYRVDTVTAAISL